MIPRQILRPLPARAAALAGESLASLIRRTAESMGYDSPGRLSSLLSDVGDLSNHANLFPPGPVLNRLAELLGRPAESLQRMTVHHFSARLVLSPPGCQGEKLCDSKTILKYFVTSTSPVCAYCLAEDAMAYDRLLWSFRPLPICVSHSCLLVARCPSCHRSLRWDRRDVRRCVCGGPLEPSQALQVSSEAIDLSGILQRLLLDRAALLPKMSSAATFWWAERLATAAAKTPAWMGGVAKRMDLPATQATEWLSWLSAADILAHWPVRLEEFLDVFQQVAKHRTTSTGINRRFGLLLREAAHLEQIGYSAPASALREYLLQHYSAGHLSGKVCLFQGRQHRSLLAKRPWITQTEAARLLRVRQPAIAALVAHKVLAGQIHAAGPHGRSVGLVSRAAVESLQEELQRALGVGETARRLGVGRHAVLDFIHTKLLPRAVRTAKGWRICLRSVETLEDFCRSLPPLGKQTAGSVSLRQATRVCGPSGLRLSQLLKLMQAGSLEARMVNLQDGLNGIAVSRAGLATLQKNVRSDSDLSGAWSLQRAAGNLFPDRPMKPQILKKWIRAGLLRAHRAGSRTIFSADEIGRFRAAYCLAPEAAKVLGISRSTLSRWEVQGRIKPAYGKRITPQAGFSLYRREDLRRLAETAS